ncbi:MAG TPA: hypothetical protein VJZ01_08120 [Lachnospiraceae bacterium]|nr:hypothetical protein [Lachnospiraceae bacterium]
MAKKFGKFLLFTALAGAAAAGAYYYLKQKDNDPFQDFDDFDDDIEDFFDDENASKTTSEREYVSLDRSQSADEKPVTEETAPKEEVPEE